MVLKQYIAFLGGRGVQTMKQKQWKKNLEVKTQKYQKNILN